MNILVIGKFYIEGFGSHIVETLTAAGHSVRQFEPGSRAGRSTGQWGYRIDQARNSVYSVSDALPVVRASRIKRLWETVDRGRIDLTVVCHDFLLPDEVDQLKRRSLSPVVLWFPDPLGIFGKSMFMNASYDALFFKDPYIVQTLAGVLRTPVFYLPECFNPQQHSLPEDAIGADPLFKCDVTTAGNLHPWRVAFYSHLTDYHVKLWGLPPPLWILAGPVAAMHQKRVVYNHDKVRAFRGAKIVVNNLAVSEVWGVNVRTFEAAGAGAFQMVDWRPGLGQLFEDGKELVSFRSISELKQNLDHWLPRDEERKVIAQAGMRRAHRDHTYNLRISLMLDTIAGREKGFPLPRIQYL